MNAVVSVVVWLCECEYQWLVVDGSGGLWLVVGGWWLVVGGWWLVVGGWCVVVGGWWLVVAVVVVVALCDLRHRQ
jgi:hypothetical protein